jgi:acyl-CoA reductase-like NAD-dependent aldehyde dehydrogenase
MTAGTSKNTRKTNTTKETDNQNIASRLTILKTYKIFINGQFPRTESGRYYPLKLSNGDNINMSLSSRKDIRNAVLAAREAQEKWANRSALNRSQILYRLAEMLETRSLQFIDELILCGESPEKAKREVDASVDRLVYYAGWCDKYQALFGTVNPVSSSHFNFSSCEAMGVVTIVAPEESGLLGLLSVVAPVIAGGNTCVILASEQKALCAVTFSEVLATSDVPAGVVNILTGQRKELLPHMSNHMDVNAVYLSSSDKAELKLVEELAALNVKRSQCEFVADWHAGEIESPYRILQFQEVKTTWHPIGI